MYILNIYINYICIYFYSIQYFINYTLAFVLQQNVIDCVTTIEQQAPLV